MKLTEDQFKEFDEQSIGPDGKYVLQPERDEECVADAEEFSAAQPAQMEHVVPVELGVGEPGIGESAIESGVGGAERFIH